MNLVSKNTANTIFNNEDAKTISDFIFSINNIDEDEGMWISRAYLFLNSAMYILVYLRDKNKSELNADTILNNISPLDKIIELSEDENIPMKYRGSLLRYVESLPKFITPLANQRKTTLKQQQHEMHDYIIMQLISGLSHYQGKDKK